jgi:MFS transporter, DHA1 family, multidrug resistance protein
MSGRLSVVISIFLLILLQQIPVDIYLPSFPDMANHFSVPPKMIQETLTLYILGFGISPLFWGPLSDKYGRRKILLSSLVLFTLANLGCAITNSIYWMLIFRVIAGIAGGGLQISTSAMARDIATGKSLLLLSSYMSLMWAIIPIVAPVIGSHIQDNLGWRSNFYFILLLSLPILYFMLSFLPETIHEKEKLSFRTVIRRFDKLFHNTKFNFYVITTGLSFSLTIAFCTAAPFLFQQHMGLNVIQFGWLMFVVAGGYLIGVLVNSFILHYFSVERIMQGGLVASLAAAGLMVFFAAIDVFTVLSVVGPVFLIIFSQGFIFPNAIGLAMNNLTHDFGLSSSLLTSFQMIVVGSVSQFVTSFDHSDPLPLAITMLGIVILLCVLYILFIRFVVNRKLK